MRLVEMPQIGKPRHYHNQQLEGLRSWRVSGFERYHIFYRPIPGGIHVVHVYHDGRNLAALLGLN